MTRFTDPTGYNEEERQFHEKELEALRAMRAKLDAARQAKAKEAVKAAHWMKCPKCGADLKEVTIGSVCIDRCQGCAGIFLDKGELEVLRKLPPDSKFLATLLG